MSDSLVSNPPSSVVSRRLRACRTGIALASVPCRASVEGSRSSNRPRTARWAIPWLAACAACSAAGRDDGQPFSFQVEAPPPASLVDDESTQTSLETAGPDESESSRASETTARIDGTETTCASVQAELEAISRPVDVVMVVDNSPSMDDEAQSVQDNINRSFAAILEASGVDYRVILISEHANSRLDDTALCIAAPLSGQTTCHADEPAFSERFFHYSTRVGSENSFEVLLETFAPPLEREDDFDLAPNGWSEWLREDARLAFLEISDDDSDLSALDFLFGLEGLDPERFGSPDAPAFAWHSIVGLAEKSNASAPYAPGEPLESGECEGNGGDVANAGEVYQQLSRLTGGLRFPICQYDAYDAVFREIASEVASASRLPCEFALPTPPPGMQLVVDDARVRLLSDASEAPSTLVRVDDPSACHDAAFLRIEDRLALCEAACSLVRTQPRSRLDIEFTCASALR